MKEYHDSFLNSIKAVVTLLIGPGELILWWAARIPVGPCDSDAGAVQLAEGSKCFRVQQICLLPESCTEWFRKAGAATIQVWAHKCNWASVTFRFFLLLGIGRRSGTFSTSEIHPNTWHVCCSTEAPSWLEISPFQMANFMAYLWHRYEQHHVS